jgi:hypothetical protein
MTQAAGPAGEERDTALFRERTELAWSRSGLAFVVAAAVLLRRLWPLRGAHQVVAVTCISIGAMCWVLVIAWGRLSAERAGTSRQPLNERRARAMTASTIALAVAAFAFAFFPPA